tara:strand:+ start:9375 stop:10145 length:771 start_codon:yes stop_codon:yes gene_type:complete
MTSRIYEGIVRHRRHTPREHAFSYRVAMPFLRVDEIPALLAGSRLWSARGRALGEFRRSDFLGDPRVALDTAVRDRVQRETGERPSGPVYLLANLRYFGFSMNPISCYYCYNADESRLEYVVAEVTNTPWNERHSYVLRGPAQGRWLRTEFDKAMHVSPFNPMDMRYHWRSNTPDQRLLVHLENHREGARVFDATLSLSARELSPAALNRLLLNYPFMTAKVGLAIYWQALKLFFKGVPLHAHPGPAKPALGASDE